MLLYLRADYTQKSTAETLKTAKIKPFALPSILVNLQVDKAFIGVYLTIASKSSLYFHQTQ